MSVHCSSGQQDWRVVFGSVGPFCHEQIFPSTCRHKWFNLTQLWLFNWCDICIYLLVPKNLVHILHRYINKINSIDFGRMIECTRQAAYKNCLENKWTPKLSAWVNNHSLCEYSFLRKLCSNQDGCHQHIFISACRTMRLCLRLLTLIRTRKIKPVVSLNLS